MDRGRDGLGDLGVGDPACDQAVAKRHELGHGIEEASRAVADVEVVEVVVPHGRAGEVVLVVVCGLDHTEARIGELQLAEKQRQLKASEALKAAVFDNALAALVSTDHTGSIVEFNPAAETMFGWRRADVLGRKVGELLIPERHRRTYWNEIPGMLGRRVELEARRADGREFPIEMVMWRTEADGTGINTGKERGFGLRYGIGGQLGLTREWAIRADLDRYDLPLPGGKENLDTVMFGVQYTFR